jgi:uncharacterized protein (DUF2252 family)
LNVIRRIKKANQARDPERLAMKYRIMRGNAFSFLRGTCHLFYDRLPKDGVFKRAPLAWVCGDLHLENFGSYKGDNRLTYFDINDFDEAALAPVSWDVVRLLTSILVGAPTFGVNASDARTLCKQYLDAYACALALGKPRWVERETAHGMVKTLLDRLQLRTRTAYLNSRTVAKGGQRRFRLDGKKTMPVSPQQRQRVEAFMRHFAKSQPDPAFYEVLDVARRIAGTGSLGVDRYAVLVAGKGSPNQNYMLDLKQALPSSVAAHRKRSQPVWASEAQRVVSLQQRTQAVSMAFLHAVELDGVSYVLRGLQPSEDRVPLSAGQHDLAGLAGVMRTMGQCTAWDHLRGSGRQGSAIADELIAFAQRKGWRREVLDAARALAKQVEQDWRDYCAAYDAGEFPIALGDGAAAKTS